LRVLAIGAHPDDVELGAAGTLARHSHIGDEVHALVLTHGEKSGKRRDAEARKSARLLGFKSIVVADLKDTQVTDTSETIDLIEKQMELIKPDRLYCHNVRDTHQDHRNAAKACIAACRKSDVRQILHYIGPSRQVDFRPNLFVDITRWIDLKLKSLKLFQSQNDKNYMREEVIRGIAAYWGYVIDTLYAECFEIERWVEI
jgi:LmbE family N-acetylglucosaminyl deacetylase